MEDLVESILDYIRSDYTDVLIKVTNNKPQSTLSGKIRKENTKNVYKLINFEKIDNRKILIFDDIYTTGATIKACIQELRKANVAKIGVLTLAKDQTNNIR